MALAGHQAPDGEDDFLSLEAVTFDQVPRRRVGLESNAVDTGADRPDTAGGRSDPAGAQPLSPLHAVERLPAGNLAREDGNVVVCIAYQFPVEVMVVDSRSARVG